jgi:hypothetical protein
LVNFDASTLWIRDRTNLMGALDATPEFLRTKHGDEGGTSQCLCLQIILNILG